MPASHPIHIAFCVNDAYVPYITVTIRSIVENLRHHPVHIHILSDGISSAGKKRLNQSIQKTDRVSLHIYEIDDTPLQGLETGCWTIYTWYRILIPETLSPEIKRVLYLDADTLVTNDISELFALDMESGEGKSIAATEDIFSNEKSTYDRLGYDRKKNYICAGILLMNLDYWRKHQLAEKMINWAKSNRDRILAPDQDAINYICQDTKILLPLRFNIFHSFFINERYFRPPYKTQVKECILRPAIVHYSGYVPWIKDEPPHLLYNEWNKYNNMLPHPVKTRYRAKGLLRWKLRCWDIFHPFKDRYSSWAESHKLKILNM